MESLIVLATIMALFGVIGYLRGTKSSLFTAAVIVAGLLVIGQLSGPIARTINGANFAARFALAGGLSALGGSSDRTAALNEVFKRMPPVTPLINADGTGIGMLVVFGLLAAAGFLLGMLKIFKSKSSLLGLLIGLFNGYVLSAYLLPRILPAAGLRLPLPAWLSGAQIPVPCGSAPVSDCLSTGPSLSGAFLQTIADALNKLADGKQLAVLLTLVIVLFVLIATRRGGRGK